MSNELINPPIFLLGSPRSGTTIFYEILAGHPDLGWFSNYTAKLRIWPLALLSRLYGYRRLYDSLKRTAFFLPKPFEGKEILFHCNVPVRWVAGEINEQDAACLKRIIKNHLKWQGKPRFVNKHVMHNQRIPYLEAIFSNAVYVDMVRDPFSVVASILNWRDRAAGIRRTYTIWAQGKYAPNDWNDIVKPVVVKAATWWADGNRSSLEMKDKLGRRYFKITYEEFAGDFKGTMAKVLAHCSLDAGTDYIQFLETFNIRNMNRKYDGQFTEQHKALIWEIVGPVAEKLGYTYL